MSDTSLVDQNAVVLVSGGAKGITASCVIKLAERTRCKFILLGRSSAEMPALGFDPSGMDEAQLKRGIAADLTARGEKPLPAKIQKLYSAVKSSLEISGTIQAVEQAGGKAEYLAVDVTDGQRLQEQIAGPVARLGNVTGIIHGAGTLVDKLIEKKSESDYETVVSPKVKGLENMLTSVNMPDLKFLVLFSSIVGFFGNVGQSDYAIANEILNKSAYLMKRKYPDCHVISINWGPWDSGMVTPELKKMFEARHVEIIPTEVGARLLVDALAGGQEAVQVVVGGAPARPAAHVEGELRQYQIKRRLRVDDNPFLFDHMIGEHPVLPATCAASWAAYTCEQLYPGYRFFSIENYRVLKGIVFDDNLPDEHVLDLKEVHKSEEKIVFDVLVWSLNKRGKTQYHYSVRVTIMKDLPEPPVQTLQANSLVSGSVNISGEALYQNGTLFHGPSFQGVRDVLHISKGKLVMRVVPPQLSDKIQGQFPAYTANPFIYDAIVQCLLIWAQNYYDAPCLPSSLRKLEQYRPIPFDVPSTVTMEVESQTEMLVVGTILVTDDQGKTYVKIEGLEGTISPHLNRLIGRKSVQAV
jgi:NAD(P)-dependent dehydrogenase (short-subunit alcohol dehydrogenase family)